MRARARAVAVAAAVAVLSAGCSSRYMPRPRAGIAMTMESGQIVFVRDGQRFKDGGFGKGLRKAVQGVPAAERAAGEFRERLITGIIALAASVILLGFGLSRMTIEILDDDPSGDDSAIDGLSAGLLIGGFIAYGIGLYYVATAPPYMYDAINIYNDSVEGFVPRPPAGGSWIPPAAPPPATPPPQ